MLEEQKEKLESKLTEASKNNRVALRELRELKARFLQQYQKEKVLWGILIFSILGLALAFYLGLHEIANGIAEVRHIRG